MIGFTKFSMASKAMWANCLCTEISNDWKHVPKFYLKSVVRNSSSIAVMILSL